MRSLLPIFALCTLALLSASRAGHAQIYQYTAPDGTLEFSTTPRKGTKAEKVIGGHAKPSTKTAENTPSAPNPNPRRSSDAFDAIIHDAAGAYNVPFALIKAVIRAESGFNPHAVSSAGAVGLMQLMPSTAKTLNCKNPFEPKENIFAGTQYLKILLSRYNGDLNLTLAAYNAGSSAVAHAGGVPFENTRRYIERVYAYYREYLST